MTYRLKTEEEKQDYYFGCITTTSIDYARRYIPQASLDTLRRCLQEIEGRGYCKTLRRMIETRIGRLEREGKS